MSPRFLAIAAVAAFFSFGTHAAETTDPKTSPEEPGSARINETLQPLLPAYWKVSGLKVVATVNEGDAVEPKLKQRIEASISPIAALYSEAPGSAGKLAPFVVIVETVPADNVRTLYGIAYSSYRAGKWSVRIGLENGVGKLGKPRDIFARPTVVAGSEIASEAAKRLSLAQVLLDTFQKENLSRVSRYKAEIAAANAKHAAALSALKAGNIAELDALEAAQAKAIDGLAKKAEALTAPLEADIAKIKAEHAAAIEKLKAKQAEELATLKSDGKAELLDAETQRLEILASREKAHGEKAKAVEAARTKAREALRDARKAAFDALETALKSDDINIRRGAVEAAFSQNDETLKRIALVQSLNSGDWVLQEGALRTILDRNPLLAVQIARQEKENFVATIDVAELDAGTGNFSGTFQLPDAEGRGGKGSIGQGGLTWRDEACSLSLTLQDDGILTGRGQCGKATFAATLRLY